MPLRPARGPPPRRPPPPVRRDVQQAVPLPYTRSKEEVLTVLHEAEHELLPRAIRLLAEGRVRFDERNPRLVVVDERALEADGQR